MNKDETSDSLYEDQIHLAERELSAFVRAVTALFGPEKAKRAVEDWLDESILAGRGPRSSTRDWRAVTVAASTKLASQLNLAPHHRVSARSTD